MYQTFLAMLLLFSTQSQQDATAIVKKANEKMRGNSMEAEMTIRTIRTNWSREMKCKIFLKGNDLSMVLIESPAKDKGISFLKRKKELWNWIPTLERVIKMPPSMMAQSWMGTDFTNDDLVKESSIVEDYTHVIIADTMVQERECYKIQMIPKEQAAVVWSKVVLCIDKKDFIEMNSQFYDEDGKLVNSIYSYDIKWMNNRLIPTRFEVIPADKKNQKTEMIYNKIIYNKEIDDNFFSIETMKKIF